MRKHLKGLDTLRAIGAIIVVVGHIELIKMFNGLDNLVEVNFPIFPSGHISVVLFFVLSGFLITLLLVRETQATNTVSYRKFYLRKILRIYPVYYLTLLASSVLIETNSSFISNILCLTIFPNVAHAIDERWVTSPQIWSIGVEVQFYIFWPVLFATIFLSKWKKYFPILLLLFTVIYPLSPIILGYINAHYVTIPYMWAIEKFFYGSKYHCIAIGALIGLAYSSEKNWIQILNNNKIFIPLSIISLVLWILKFDIGFFTDEVFSILFALIILGAIGSKTVNIDHSITKFLGKISYGIYMYHWFIIVLAIKLLPQSDNLFYYNLLLYVVVLFLTIFSAWLSYAYYEKWFLRLKEKYKPTRLKA